MKTYAEPESSPLLSSSSWYALTTAVLPFTATEYPKASPSAPSEAVSLAVTNCNSWYLVIVKSPGSSHSNAT